MDTNNTNESGSAQLAMEMAPYSDDRAFKKMSELFQYKQYGDIFRAMKRVVDSHPELFDTKFDEVYDYFDAIFNSEDPSISGADFYKFQDKLMKQFWDRMYTVETRPIVVFESEN